MSEEILYQVTPEDKVVGSVSRTDAHNDASLIHREVAVLLKDQKGRVLLAQRSWNKTVLPGRLRLPLLAEVVLWTKNGDNLSWRFHPAARA